MTAPSRREFPPANPPHDPPHQPAPTPTVFGPTDVDAGGLLGRLTTKLEVTTSGGTTTTIRVRGELLQETAPMFVDAVADLGDDDTVEQLVVDLSGTTFMDSTGLGTLVSLRNQVQVRGARFALVRPQDKVFRLFELTRLDTVFEFADAG